MGLIELRNDPSPRELAWFGVLLLIFAGVIGTLVWRATGNLVAPGYIWGGAAVLVAVYYIVPPVRRPLFVGWMYAAYPIGWVMSHVLLGAIYFVMFTSIGLVLRAFRYDPLTRRIDRSAASYWARRDPVVNLQRYFRQS